MNKYRKVRAAKEELAKVPIYEVAKIAAALVQNPGSVALKDSPPKKDSDDGKTTRGKATTQKPLDEEGPLVVATAKAFALLEIAYYGKSGLTHEDSYEAGLAEFVEGKKIYEEYLEARAKITKWEPEYDEQGQPLPVPFDEGLAKLIPKPGVRASQTVDKRMTLFKAFMIDRYQTARPEQDERERMTEVEDRIAAMKRDGIPPHLFDQWLVLFPEWWQRKVSEIRSAAGETGLQAKTEKKGKQGRVTSKADKRLGARPPVLTLSEGEEGA